MRRELTLSEGQQTAAAYPCNPRKSYCLVVCRFPDDEIRAGYRYTCTRPDGHDGPHVAHSSETACAIWGEETGL